MTYFFKEFVYSFERERKTETAQAGEKAEGEGEADPLLSWEPDMGLNPRTWRSQPELKTDA